MILSEAFHSYITYLHEKGNSIRGIELAEYRLRRFVEGREETVVADIAAPDLYKFIESLKSADLADATLAGYTGQLKGFFNWCVDRDILIASPARKLKKYSYDSKTRQPAPEKYIGLVAAQLTQYSNHRGLPSDLRDALYISMTIDSGARLGEILSIRTAKLRKSLERGRPTENGRVGYAVTGRGKTGSARITFFEETAMLARRWLRERPWPGAEYIFISVKTGANLRPTSLGRAFERVCRFANVPVFRAHSVRKRNVHGVKRISGDAKVAQFYAGHKSIETTLKHYNDVDDQEILDAAAELASRRRDTKMHHVDMARLFGLDE